MWKSETMREEGRAGLAGKRREGGSEGGSEGGEGEGVRQVKRHV